MPIYYNLANQLCSRPGKEGNRSCWKIVFCRYSMLGRTACSLWKSAFKILGSNTNPSETLRNAHLFQVEGKPYECIDESIYQFMYNPLYISLSYRKTFSRHSANVVVERQVILVAVVSYYRYRFSKCFLLPNQVSANMRWTCLCISRVCNFTSTPCICRSSPISSSTFGCLHNKESGFNARPTAYNGSANSYSMTTIKRGKRK